MRRRVGMLRTIQTVAVFRFGRRDEAPIVGISQPGDQRLASERTELGFIFFCTETSCWNNCWRAGLTGSN